MHTYLVKDKHQIFKAKSMQSKLIFAKKCMTVNDLRVLSDMDDDVLLAIII
jgi:hypothetical protein